MIISHNNEQSFDLDRQVVHTKWKCRLFNDISNALVRLLLLCGDVKSNPGPVSIGLYIMNSCFRTEIVWHCILHCGDFDSETAICDEFA